MLLNFKKNMDHLKVHTSCQNTDSDLVDGVSGVEEGKLRLCVSHKLLGEAAAQASHVERKDSISLCAWRVIRVHVS